jgi:hypothetical protein
MFLPSALLLLASRARRRTLILQIVQWKLSPDGEFDQCIGVLDMVHWGTFDDGDATQEGTMQQ